MNNMKWLHVVSFVLVIIGALNWLLVGLGEIAGMGMTWNLVHWILGSWPPVEAIVYILVGLAGIWLLVKHKMDCKTCSTSMPQGGMPMQK